MGWTCGWDGEKSISYRILVGKSVGNRPLGRQRSKWDNNIKLEIG
jgi:hypothetical protein